LAWYLWVDLGGGIIENTLQEYEKQIVSQTSSQTLVPQEKETKRPIEIMYPIDL